MNIAHQARAAGWTRSPGGSWMSPCEKITASGAEALATLAPIFRKLDTRRRLEMAGWREAGRGMYRHELLGPDSWTESQALCIKAAMESAARSRRLVR